MKTNNLGDLKALKVGDEVTTINEKGNVGTITLISSIESDKIRTKRPHSPSLIGAYNPETGKTLLSGHTNGGFPWFITANPSHIKKAKKAAQRAQALADKKKKVYLTLLDKALPIGKYLAEGDAETVAEVLTRHLDAKQLKTLKGWLDI